jgi:hypothetical protein
MRKFLILCLMAGLLVMGGVVSAQDTPPVFCGSLAQADCSILQQSQTAMKDLKSADVSLTLNFTGENIPDMPSTEPLTITLTGTGSFSGDMSGLGAMPTMNSSDPSASLAYATKALAAVNAKLNLTLTIPPSVSQMAGGSSGASIPSSIPINLVLVDGKGYIDLDSLAPVLAATGQETTSMPKGWAGLDLVEALNQMAPMMTQMASMATQEAGASDAMQAFMDPTFIGKYLKIERGADATVNGDAVAVFNSTVDIAALLQDPAVQAEIQKQAAATGSAQAEGSVAMISQFASAMSLTATTQVGTADNIVRSASTDLTVDLTAMMAMMPTPDGATTQMAAPIIKVHFDYSLSNINSAQAVTAPEGATLIPLSSLMGGSSSMDSGMSGMDTNMSGLDSTMSGMDSMMEGMDTLMATPAS